MRGTLLKTMDELFEQIPRAQGRRLEKTITLWVEPSTKHKYDVLKEIHKVRVAECMRKVMDQELDRILAIVTANENKAG